MTPARGHGARRRILTFAAAVLAAAGISSLAVAFTGQETPPPLPASGVGTVHGGRPAAGGPLEESAPSGGPALEHLPPAAPARLVIPAIGVRTRLTRLGHDPDGSLEVPTSYTTAGWYAAGPAPGQVGPAVLAGHVDSSRGPAVFFRLAALRPGDDVTVTRADRAVLTFRVDAVREYPKDAFPTVTVYGNTTRAELRLITCGGSFDRRRGHYRDNIVAFAHLTGARR